MEKRNGFTLIELLAVIAILLLLAVMLIININKLSKSNKEEIYEAKLDLIKLSAKNYANDHLNELSDECTIITVKDLLDYKYIESDERNQKNIIDSRTNESMNDMEICLTYDGTIYVTMLDSSNNERNFETDSWKIIKETVQSGTYPYKVGDRKKITITEHENGCSSVSYYGSTQGSYNECVPSTIPTQNDIWVRVSNVTPCTGHEKEQGKSETSCGFVVEFEDIVENYNFNKISSKYQYGTNKGGWRNSEMRAYINETLYKALPKDLRDVIADTTVVSGRGLNDVNPERTDGNWETIDKLYLLSAHEVYEDGENWIASTNDTAWNTTRQLDYYAKNNVKTDRNTYALKKYNDEFVYWWLRTASSSNDVSFFHTHNQAHAGGCSTSNSYNAYGVSPAFRID